MIRTCAHCGAIIPLGNPFGLTTTERRIYTYIAKHPGCSTIEVSDALFAHQAYDGGPWRNNFSVHLSRIRKKLVNGGIHIIFSRSQGYRLVKEPTP